MAVESSKALVWDETGKHLYETGVSKGVLWIMGDDGKYSKGVAWSGLTSVSDTPSGAEESAFYADDIKYLSLYSLEEYGGTINAYTYPDEFAQCDGSGTLTPGVTIRQQKRRRFGFSYQTRVGNDIVGSDYSYKIHIVYGAMASPSEREYATINDSPEPIEMSWEFTTIPTNVTGMKPTSHLEIDVAAYLAAKTEGDAPDAEQRKKNLEELEKKLYGDTNKESELPLPDEIKTILDKKSEAV